MPAKRGEARFWCYSPRRRKARFWKCGSPPLPSNDGEARFKVSQSFFPHGSGLAFSYAGGAFFHEEDLHGREHDLEVFEEAGLGDIHQIHQELVVGRRIVLAIDLGIAGESALGLEAEVPLGEFFFVLGGDLGALGAGAYDGHVAFQDVQELREFIEADSADEAADGGDAGIVLTAGESRHAVFFGIHAHTAEFVDREYLPVFGETVLLVEGGAAVSFDKEADDEHGDGEDDEGCKG